LTKANVTSIIDLMMTSLNQRLADKELTVELTDAARDAIIDAAYDPLYGARPLRRYLQHTVETLISRQIIADQVGAGETLTVDAQNGELTVKRAEG
jgi:ATP-dependent Clp protease ATP-binding subunit ClpB